MTFEQELESGLPVLRRVSIRLTRNQEEARDLVQSTVVRAMEARDNYQQGTNAGAWLCRIATNLFINGRIRDATRRRILSRIEEEGLLASSTPSPENDVDRKEVRAAVRALPAQYRDAVELVDIAGLRYKEAAASMGVPVGTVMSRLHRGRRLLAASLEAA